MEEVMHDGRQEIRTLGRNLERKRGTKEEGKGRTEGKD